MRIHRSFIVRIDKISATEQSNLVIENYNKLIPKIKEFGSYKIEIVAHTDLRASNNYNKWLSERRLNRVKQYLVSKGITASVIDGSYKGEEDPVHSCEDCDETKHKEIYRERENSIALLLIIRSCPKCTTVL